MLSVALGKILNLRDTLWISEIRIQLSGPISKDNEAIDYHIWYMPFPCVSLNMS